MKKYLLIAIFLLSILSLNISCKKDKDCYDEQLYQQHKNDICPMNCPGVTGCDGKTYCNECIALTQGIKVEK